MPKNSIPDVVKNLVATLVKNSPTKTASSAPRIQKSQQIPNASKSTNLPKITCKVTLPMSSIKSNDLPKPTESAPKSMSHPAPKADEKSSESSGFPGKCSTPEEDRPLLQQPENFDQLEEKSEKDENDNDRKG